ncbi:MAG: NADH-quinone oxidoreductase subunit [Rickettsiales bacterium]|jgi:NADH-quinone oxidoreductase subunit J|nr:NADH-quinone oxidoreductase subunit [Rickettsiales bacterium]
MLLETLLFYSFSSVMILSALMVVAARNPVHSVLFLILAFFNSAGLFIMLGAEFIAMLMVIVYVGAVAVLFLFVVMMMDINFAVMRQGFIRYLPLGLLVVAALAAEFFMVFKTVGASQTAMAKASLLRLTPPVEGITNTEAIGAVLYTHYVYPFQTAGIILLVAMIGAIVLTLRSRPGVKRQSIVKQLDRKPEDCIRVVNVETGKGVGGL